MKNVFVCRNHENILLEIFATQQAARDSWILSYQNKSKDTGVDICFKDVDQFTVKVMFGQDFVGSIVEKHVFEGREHL